MCELGQHLPFKVLKISYCEGDDIIGSLALNNKNKKITVISSDKDYLQLLNPNLKVFSIMHHDYIKHPDPEMFLKESCLQGQPKDNIFNVITPLDYPEELRKPPMGQKRMDKFFINGLKKSLDQDIEYKRKYIDNDGKPKVYNSICNLKERFDYNMNLMDFRKIPDSIKKIILNQYNNYKYPHPEKILEFFTSNNWFIYLDNITNVERTLYGLYGSENN